MLIWKETNKGTPMRRTLHPLLHEYSDMLPGELNAGLPPMWDIQQCVAHWFPEQAFLIGMPIGWAQKSIWMRGNLFGLVWRKKDPWQERIISGRSKRNLGRVKYWRGSTTMPTALIFWLAFRLFSTSKTSIHIVKTNCLICLKTWGRVSSKVGEDDVDS